MPDLILFNACTVLNDVRTGYFLIAGNTDCLVGIKILYLINIAVSDFFQIESLSGFSGRLNLVARAVVVICNCKSHLGIGIRDNIIEIAQVDRQSRIFDLIE